MNITQLSASCQTFPTDEILVATEVISEEKILSETYLEGMGVGINIFLCVFWNIFTSLPTQLEFMYR